MTKGGAVEDVNFKTLVGVKWKDRHFHVIGEGFETDQGTLIMLFRWTFPEDIPYEGTFTRSIKVREAGDARVGIRAQEFHLPIRSRQLSYRCPDCRANPTVNCGGSKTHNGTRVPGNSKMS
jgi:hypothetical protein